MTYNLKRCTECREILPAKAKFFPRNKSRVGGLATRCHECNRKVVDDWRKSNREHVNVNQQIRYYTKLLRGAA